MSAPAGTTSAHAGQAAEHKGEGNGATASVPFMITNAMRAKLRELGFSDVEIRELNPQQAHDWLALAADLAASPRPEAPAESPPAQPGRPSAGEDQAGQAQPANYVATSSGAR